MKVELSKTLMFIQRTLKKNHKFDKNIEGQADYANSNSPKALINKTVGQEVPYEVKD